MQNLIYFIVYVVVFVTLTFIVQYFLVLFSDKRDQYLRDELIDYRHILKHQWSQLVGEDKQFAYSAMGIGLVLGFLLTVMGGAGSYFTHSALFVILLYFALPLLRGRFPQTQENQKQFFTRLLHSDYPLFFSFSMAVIAQIFVSVGKINFLWLLGNAVIILLLVFIRNINQYNLGKNKDTEEQSDVPNEENDQDEEHLDF